MRPFCLDRQNDSCNFTNTKSRLRCQVRKANGEEVDGFLLARNNYIERITVFQQVGVTELAAFVVAGEAELVVV